jgi:hypothetical protein
MFGSISISLTTLETVLLLVPLGISGMVGRSDFLLLRGDWKEEDVEAEVDEERPL